MAYEIRGPMLVYLALVVTSSFTSYYRVATFVFLTAYSVYCGDLLADIPFYVGALLADLALVLGNNSPAATGWSASRGLRGIVKNYWAIAVGLLGLFLGGYPPDSPERSSWSRFLLRWGYVFMPAGCTPPFVFSNNRVIHMVVPSYRRFLLHSRDSLLAFHPKNPVPPHPGILRKHFLPNVPHTLVYDAVVRLLGHVRNNSARRRFDWTMEGR